MLVSRDESDSEVPSSLGYDLRLVQRVVILGKAGLPADEARFSNPSGGTFAAKSTVVVAGVPFVSRRSWTSVDAVVNKRSFRFINTHLESVVSAIRVAQVGELLSGPANTTLPVVLVGDLNSYSQEAAPSAYSSLLAAGFIDTWTQANGSDPGLTCCNAENLLNPSPTFLARLDHVLTRPSVTVVQSRRVGIDGDNRTPAGLWPSDHAGVVATLGSIAVGDGRARWCRADACAERIQCPIVRRR